MQTTLLGIGIAIILALGTALVGPYFIDWDGYRPAIESKAAEIIGVPVMQIAAGTVSGVDLVWSGWCQGRELAVLRTTWTLSEPTLVWAPVSTDDVVPTASRTTT